MSDIVALLRAGVCCYRATHTCEAVKVGREAADLIEKLRKERCTCLVDVCDCQAPPTHVSMECPIHNDDPMPADTCPVHGTSAVASHVRGEK